MRHGDLLTGIGCQNITEGTSNECQIHTLRSLNRVCCPSVLAQNNDIINILGTVEKVDATSISVKNDESGVAESFRLAPDLLVLQNKTATLADVKPNDFVASAAVREADGKLHSKNCASSRMPCEAWAKAND
jgi:hypothetical protein